MQVVKLREGGIVRRVVLLDDAGDEVVLVTRFLSHLTDAGYSPNTVCAYAYDLRHLVWFLDHQALGWKDFRPSTALEFLAYLRRVPSRRPAQRLGLTVATEQAGCYRQRLCSGCSRRPRASSTGRSPLSSTPRATICCNAGLITRWASCRIGISRSSVRRAVSSRCAARCGSGCRCGYRGR